MSPKQKKKKFFSALTRVDNSTRLMLLAILLLILLSSITIIVSLLFELVIPAIAGVVVLLIFTLVLVIRFTGHLSDRLDDIDNMKGIIEERKEYLAAFAHHTRTSLNDFSMIIDLMESTNLQTKQKELIDTLLASVNNLVRSVNELSVHTAQEVPVGLKKKFKFDIISALNSTIELYDNIKNDGSKNITVKYDEDFKTVYASDPVSLKQIFMGILNEMNIRELADYNIDIRIKTINQGRLSDNISFSFAIDRRGLFDQEEEADNALIHRIYPELIDGMGGSYSISLSEGRSELTFVLPLLRVKDEPQPSEVARRIRKMEESSGHIRALSDARILLVEDNPINQKIVHISLEKIVKNIDTAGSGKEALDLFGKSNYDIILMDIQLPVMDGIMTAQKIREVESSTNTHVPIFAITANAMIGDKEKCLSAGMDEYLSKPFHPDQLIELISRHLGSGVSGKAGA